MRGFIMTVKSIKYSDSGKTAAVEFTDGSSLTVEADVLDGCAVAVGEALCECDRDVLLSSDEYLRALKKALSILSYSDNSKRALKRKLAEAGYSRSAAQRAVERVVELGYVDEQRQLERLILSNTEQLFGPYKIITRLLSKGYDLSSVRCALNDLTESGRVDFEENLNTLILKKLGESPDADEKEKLLHKYGYRK